MAQPWTAKDPAAVLDYVYRIPLDAGDNVSSGTPLVTKLSGDVAIDSQSLASAPNTTDEGYGQDVTVTFSGGTDGTTSVFQVGPWNTAGGRTDEDFIALPIISKNTAPLLLTGYAKPSPAHLALKYPAFADVPPATVQFWLTDAERYVTNAWSEGDYAAGLMALAAHNLLLAGYGTDASLSGVIPAGVKSFKSGSLDVSLTDQAANRGITGDYTTTRYGQEYSALLSRNRGGPYVAPSGLPPYGLYPFGYPVGWPVGWP